MHMTEFPFVVLAQRKLEWQDKESALVDPHNIAVCGTGWFV